MLLMDALNLVAKFRSLFGLRVKYNPCIDINEKDLKNNVMLMFEHLKEYESAVKSGNLYELSKVLADMDVTQKGLVIQHGLQYKYPRILEEVINSNMTKLNIYGQPAIDKNGRIDKSTSNYIPPDIEKILKDAKY